MSYCANITITTYLFICVWIDGALKSINRVHICMVLSSWQAQIS